MYPFLNYELLLEQRRVWEAGEEYLMWIALPDIFPVLIYTPGILSLLRSIVKSLAWVESCKSVKYDSRLSDLPQEDNTVNPIRAQTSRQPLFAN